MKKTKLYDSKTDCCGCSACANICPKKIIEMVLDEEGFLYPRITDTAMCIGCNKCDAVCPIKHSDEIDSAFTNAFAGWRMNGDIADSASGGAAYEISKWMIESGGIVYGVQYSDDCKSAVYYRGESDSDIRKMRSSKYIQSRKNNIYQLIKRDLERGKRVLFVGMPCDTFAVKKYTEKIGENLITVSLICHGPTSENVHRSFCEKIEKQYNSSVCEINVRYKKNSQWKPYYIYAKLKNGNEFLRKFQSTDYDAAFLLFKRPSCTACHFKNNHYCADLLIGDFHNAQKGTDSYNEHGVSSLLPLTQSGNDVLNQIKDSFLLRDVELKRSVSQRAVHGSAESVIDREEFADVLNKKGITAACKISTVKREKRKKAKSRFVFKVKSIAYNILKRLKIV